MPTIVREMSKTMNVTAEFDYDDGFETTDMEEEESAETNEEEEIEEIVDNTDEEQDEEISETEEETIGADEEEISETEEEEEEIAETMEEEEQVANVTMIPTYFPTVEPNSNPPLLEVTEEAVEGGIIVFNEHEIGHVHEEEEVERTECLRDGEHCHDCPNECCNGKLDDGSGWFECPNGMEFCGDHMILGTKLC